MYLISEENHDALCVADSIEKGIAWLIRTDWLNGFTVGIDEYGCEYCLDDVVGEDSIFGYVMKIMNKDGIKGVLEWLEDFGFYFISIEVA